MKSSTKPDTNSVQPVASRRRFLGGAAAGTAAAVGMGFPAIVSAQTPRQFPLPKHVAHGRHLPRIRP